MWNCRLGRECELGIGVARQIHESVNRHRPATLALTFRRQSLDEDSVSLKGDIGVESGEARSG
jgi:hypothetical protein